MPVLYEHFLMKTLDNRIFVRYNFEIIKNIAQRNFVQDDMFRFPPMEVDSDQRVGNLLMLKDF